MSCVNIDRDNFEANFAAIKESIDAADFIAIDTELSGLIPPKGGMRPNAMDTFQIR